MLTCSTLFVWLTKMHRRLSPWFHWRCLANFHSKIGLLSHQALDYRWTNCWSVCAFCKKNYEVKIRIYFFNRISMIFYFWILKVIRKSSVYKCTFPFFSLVLPVNLTWSSGLSRVKLLIPCPWIGNINTKANRMKYHYLLPSDKKSWSVRKYQFEMFSLLWPFIVYGPFNTNAGPFNLSSYCPLGFSPKPLQKE